MLAIVIGASLSIMGAQTAPAPYRELVVTKDTVLTASDVLRTRIVVKADHVTLDGGGLTLSGPGKPGDLKTFEEAGIGVLVEGCTNVTIKNLKAKGFAIGLKMKDCVAPVVEGCDFSFNYHNPDHGWGELPARGGMILEGVKLGVFRNNKANRVWDALSLTNCDDNLLLDNDFSHTSNTCAKLWTSSRNKFLNNDLSYGIRIDRDKGEVHARDSTSVLIESGSNDNTFYRNKITHGGDGVFIRPLNGWISKGNVFIENDTSYANNNCVESWSPGNTFIRNVANRGSYGFWLGGSDQTTLIGNEASYNGLATGYHNAPEGGFAHGGIVIVGGTSSHSLISGNKLVGNNGGGIVFRGDTATKGAAWRTLHWVVQQNRIEDNKFGVWGRYGDWIHLGGNLLKGNGVEDDIADTEHLIRAPWDDKALRAPIARLRGPERAEVGQEVVFDASGSTDPAGLALTYSWRFNAESAEGPTVRRKFDKPGFYRVGLNVSNGTLAGLAFRDLIVVDSERGRRAPTGQIVYPLELGTEGSAVNWTGEQPGATEPDGGLIFEDDYGDALVDKSSLKITQRPYRGQYMTAIFPRARKADLDLYGKTKLVFWMKAENPNIPGFQEPGPVIRLYTPKGVVKIQPSKGANLYVNRMPYSEARYLWMRVEIPLAGNDDWERTVEGTPDLKHVNAFSLSMDAWGGDPFTIWLDGWRFE